MDTETEPKKDKLYASFARRIPPVVSQPGFSARHAENDSLPVQTYLRDTTHKQIGFSAHC